MNHWLLHFLCKQAIWLYHPSTPVLYSMLYNVYCIQLYILTHKVIVFGVNKQFVFLYKSCRFRIPFSTVQYSFSRHLFGALFEVDLVGCPISVDLVDSSVDPNRIQFRLSVLCSIYHNRLENHFYNCRMKDIHKIDFCTSSLLFVNSYSKHIYCILS